MRIFLSVFKPDDSLIDGKAKAVRPAEVLMKLIGSPLLLCYLCKFATQSKNGKKQANGQTEVQ